MKLTYRHTLSACHVCFIIQSIVNNYSPLLFVTYANEFALTLDQLTLLVTFNFIVQMAVDAIGVRWADKIGYRRGMVIAHATSFFGIAGLALFTKILFPFAGLMIATVFCALGSGFIEVIASPVVEALPTDEKSSAMSLLHSFYCWGHIAIVLLSTLFFALFGTENWRILTLLWALVPALNCVAFFFVPVVEAKGGEAERLSVRGIARMPEFKFFLMLMICGGAAEQAIAQWSSMFAESGLGVSKTVGDLLGPCLFGLMMAIARTFYGAMGGRIPLAKFMTVGAVGIFAGTMLTVLSPIPELALVGCGMVGVFVGIFWPGTLSLAAGRLPQAGAAMFAMLALAGDIGCALGPGIVGFVAEKIGTSDGLKTGIFCSIIFPILALLSLIALQIRDKSAKKK
ncbi:MAG: MFS transporter [Clostridia bacterium]|nr:MFS transporter [Clostridia bacterium]